MPSIKQLEVLGEVAVTVAEKVAPEATEAGLNLLSITKGKVVSAAESIVPDNMRAMMHLGPNDGKIDIQTSIDPEIIKARKFESESRTAYAKTGASAHPELQGTKQTHTLVVGGGFTGLSIAEKLSASGVPTMLVDAGRIGEGTSQLAGGMITRAGDPSFVELEEAYGTRALGLYAKGMVRAHATVMQRAATMGGESRF